MWHCCCSSSPHVRDFLSLLIRVLHQKRQHHHQQPCRTLMDVSDIYLLFIIIYSRVQQHRQPHPGALSHVRNHATINKIYPLMASICNIDGNIIIFIAVFLFILTAFIVVYVPLVGCLLLKKNMLPISKEIFKYCLLTCFITFICLQSPSSSQNDGE